MKYYAFYVIYYIFVVKSVGNRGGYGHLVPKEYGDGH